MTNQHQKLQPDSKSQIKEAIKLSEQSLVEMSKAVKTRVSPRYRVQQAAAALTVLKKAVEKLEWSVHFDNPGLTDVQHERFEQLIERPNIDLSIRGRRAVRHLIIFTDPATKNSEIPVNFRPSRGKQFSDVTDLKLFSDLELLQLPDTGSTTVRELRECFEKKN